MDASQPMTTAVDVLVIGGNPGGCAAAIAAARTGCSVLLLEPTAVLGGMNANGTFGFDCATSQALSGVAEEVAARIRSHYAESGLHDPLFDKRADLVWESHVAAKVWRELVDETVNLDALTGAVPVAVRTQGGRIAEVHWQRAVDAMGNLDPQDSTQHSVRAAVVIDASYEGDVAAWSGAPYRLGREPRSPLEPHAGHTFFNNFGDPHHPQVLPHSVLPGSTGEGDDAIMAFAYRLHCRLYDDASPDAPHRLKAPPPGYDPTLYDWGPLRHDADGRPVYFDTLYILVNGKYLLNRMVRGNNLVGPNRDYVLAHPRERHALRQRFIDHALGYLYHVQNAGGLPQLGLANDEFQDNAHLPYQIYVREGRRIVGRSLITEADLNPFITGDGLRPPAHGDVVAIGDWTFESQPCADEAPPGYKYPDGYITGRVSLTPYQIPYGCLLPTGIDNLLVCGGISATHIAFGATRCEAARIQLGIAAGIAAALARQRGCTPADVPVADIQREVLQRRGKLTYFADVESSHPNFVAIQWAALRGYVPADAQWCFGPEQVVCWREFARVVVQVLRVPISVTGMHFENLPRHDPDFRWAESLYDLGTRAGVDLFGLAALRDEDPMKTFLRLYPLHRLLPWHPSQALKAGEATAFVSRVREAQTGQPSAPLAVAAQTDAPLTRAALCELLRAALGGDAAPMAR